MPASLPLVVALTVAALAALAGWALGAWLQQRKRKPQPLPLLWALTPRPVFSTEERTLFRQLREALPGHVVLSKLPLVRFCQPADPQQVRYWYDLLGQVHVGFAICSVSGRVLAAIDLESDRTSRRSQQIKESVLSACRVRYVRCAADQVLSLPEIQGLVPVVVSAQPRSARRRAAGGTVALAEVPLPAQAAPAPTDALAQWQQAGPPQDAIYGFDEDGRPADGGAVVVETPIAPSTSFRP